MLKPFVQIFTHFSLFSAWKTVSLLERLKRRFERKRLNLGKIAKIKNEHEETERMANNEVENEMNENKTAIDF